MGDDDDNVMHETYEVSDKFAWQICIQQLYVELIEADISLHLSLRLKSWALYNSISEKTEFKITKLSHSPIHWAPLGVDQGPLFYVGKYASPPPLPIWL